MKLLGMILLVLSGLLCGLLMAGRLKKREQALLELEKMMQCFKTDIQFSLKPLVQLLEENTIFSFCKKAVDCVSYQGDPCQALQKAGKEILSFPKDVSMYQNFVSGLGKSDVDGQLQHIDLFLNLVRTQINEARAECTARSKLYVVLGVFSTLTVCIVMI